MEHEIKTLTMGRDLYGSLIARAAELYQHRPEVLAGIAMRETEFGTSPLLVDGRGDGGHGHGIMQIDDRFFAEFCKGPWRIPETNITMGAWVLAKKRQFIKHLSSGVLLDPASLERAAIAAFNAGEGNVLKALRAGTDVDAKTAHGNYSAEVLRLAELYKGLLPEAA